MINVGFTGTRYGMTLAQSAAVWGMMVELGKSRGHHGSCVGADEQFHNYALTLGWYMIGHPPVATGNRASCDFDELRPECPHLRRNCNIVEEAEIMIATPREFQEQLHGGTWFTIRRARKKLRPLAIVLPDGIVVKEQWI
jgi:hypothetical protein